MLKTRYPVEIATTTGQTVEGVFLLDKSDESCRLTLQWVNREVHAEASDYFEALCHIRTQLELEELRPVCYGASRNVYPSGMARSMGLGLKAYRTRLGERHARGLPVCRDGCRRGPGPTARYAGNGA